MSPDEFDLRAALHQGEGGGVDVDRVVAGGQALRVRRRNRLLGAAVAALVVGVGVGGGLAWGGGDGTTSQAGSAPSAPASSTQSSSEPPPNSAQQPPGAAPTLGEGAAPTSSTASGPAAISCPARPPEYHPSGADADGPLFARPVSSVVVCGYGSPTPGRLVLDGQQARELAAGLEDAPTDGPAHQCSTLARPPDELAILALTTDGTRLTTVTVALQGGSCSSVVTNGIAVRYDWHPPQSLSAVLSDRITEADTSNPSR